MESYGRQPSSVEDDTLNENGHEKTHLDICLAIFSVWHCKIKFSFLNILFFCIFWTVFMSLIVTSTFYCFEV